MPNLRTDWDRFVKDYRLDAVAVNSFRRWLAAKGYNEALMSYPELINAYSKYMSD